MPEFCWITPNWWKQTKGSFRSMGEDNEILLVFSLNFRQQMPVPKARKAGPMWSRDPCQHPGKLWHTLAPWDMSLLLQFLYHVEITPYYSVILTAKQVLPSPTLSSEWSCNPASPSHNSNASFLTRLRASQRQGLLNFFSTVISMCQTIAELDLHM